MKKLLLLLLVPVLAVCMAGCSSGDDDDDGGWGIGTGTIKYLGKTYNIAWAGTAKGSFGMWPGTVNPGYNIRFVNGSRMNDIQFGIVSSAATFPDATGTYSKSTGEAIPGTIANIRTSPTLDGEPMYGMGDIVNEEVKISRSGDTYTIEAYFQYTTGTLELYYKGGVDIQ